MNRYSAFAASHDVDVPAFPITAAKVVLFISRSLPTAQGDQLRAGLGPPETFPLPLAGVEAPTAAEGERVTRDLVGSWTEAMAYAQGSSRDVWDRILPQGSPHDLLRDPAIIEMLKSYEDYERSRWDSIRSRANPGTSVAMEREISRPPVLQR